MKKLMSGLLIVMLLASLLAVGAAEVPVYAQVDAVVENNTVTLTMTAAQDTYNGRYTLSFDEAALHFEGAQSESRVHCQAAEQGSVTLAYATSQANRIPAGTVLAKMQFAYVGRPRTTEITLAVEDFNAQEGLHLYLRSLYVNPRLPFTDVPEDRWFYEAVKEAYGAGWVDGVTDTLFAPNATMNRAMFVTILGRMAGAGTEQTQETQFTDVKADSYYAGYVAWAVEAGIVKGTSPKTFSPGAKITREQMVTFLHRYAQYQGKDVTAEYSAMMQFPDADQISPYARQAMAWAVDTKVVDGIGGDLKPQAHATRAQGVQVLVRCTHLWD